MPNFNFPEVFYNQNFKQKCCWPVVWKLVREPCALTISIVPREGWLKTFGLLCEWESSRGKASLAPECYVGFRAWRQLELSEQVRAGAGGGTEPRQLWFAVNLSQTETELCWGGFAMTYIIICDITFILQCSFPRKMKPELKLLICVSCAGYFESSRLATDCSVLTQYFSSSRPILFGPCPYFPQFLNFKRFHQ